MINKIILKLWRASGYLPLTIAIVAGLSGWIVFETGISTDYINELALVNPMHYGISLFLHDTPSDYITSMYFFVPAGVFLTYMTSNKEVLGVIAVSHIFAVMLGGMSFGLEVYGTAAAAFGLLAAALVRGTKIGTEDYSERTQRAAPVGIFVIGALGLFMIGTASDAMRQQVPYLIGFAFGGSFETVIVLAETRGIGESEEESKSEGRYIHERFGR